MSAPRPLLRRTEASAYLRSTFGIPCAVATLAKLATIGGGPSITYFGRIPLYAVEDLDFWAAHKLGEPVGSTAGKVRSHGA